MSRLNVSIVASPDDQIAVHAEFSRGEDLQVERGQVPWPDADAMTALTERLRTGRAPAAAIERLSGLLGSILFCGPVGALLRAAWRADESTPLFLTAGHALAHFPWECARDPEDGLVPALMGGIVRIGGRPFAPGNIAPRGVLVASRAVSQPRLKAVQASTRRIGRAAEIDIFSADPATGPGVRRALSSGAALVHLEGVNAGTVLLDDGPVPVERLGVGERIWLADIGGGRSNESAGLKLREAGVGVVVARQIDLTAASAAAMDRVFYRALADGETALDAVRQVRAALRRDEGEGSAAWASPVLWSAPASAVGTPALIPFPPPDMGGASEILETNKFFALPDVGSGAKGRRGAAISAAVFVRDTIRMLRSGGAGTSQAEVGRRAHVLRALGGHQTMDPDDEPQNGQFSPDERVTRLTDRLVEAMGRTDAPLASPNDEHARRDAIAQRLAVPSAAVERVALTLAAAPIVNLVPRQGLDGVEIAAAVVEELFGYHAHCASGLDSSALLSGPRRTSSGAVSRGGWLYRAIASNWRRDQIDPLEANSQGPRTRMPLLAARDDDWAVCHGGWLIIDGADAIAPDIVRGLGSALSAGEFSGMNAQGDAFRIPIPRDFRVILVGSSNDALRASGVPAVEVGPSADQSALRRLLLAEAAHWIGPADDEADLRYRGGIAEACADTAAFIRIFAPVSQSAIRTAATYAIKCGGDIATAVRAGFDTHVASRIGPVTVGAPTLNGLREGTMAALIDGVAKETKKGRRKPALMLAEWLDQGDGGERYTGLRSAIDTDAAVTAVKGWKSLPVRPIPLSPSEIALWLGADSA